MAAITEQDRNELELLADRAKDGTLRALGRLHDAIVADYRNVETWYTPDGLPVSIAADDEGVVLVRGGTVLEMDTSAVAHLCEGLLARVVNGDYRIKGAHQLLIDYGPQVF